MSLDPVCSLYRGCWPCCTLSDTNHDHIIITLIIQQSQVYCLLSTGTRCTLQFAGYVLSPNCKHFHMMCRSEILCLPVVQHVRQHLLAWNLPLLFCVLSVSKVHKVFM